MEQCCIMEQNIIKLNKCRVHVIRGAFPPYSTQTVLCLLLFFPVNLKWDHPLTRIEEIKQWNIIPVLQPNRKEINVLRNPNQMEISWNVWPKATYRQVITDSEGRLVEFNLPGVETQVFIYFQQILILYLKILSTQYINS